MKATGTFIKGLCSVHHSQHMASCFTLRTQEQGKRKHGTMKNKYWLKRKIYFCKGRTTSNWVQVSEHLEKLRLVRKNIYTKNIKKKSIPQQAGSPQCRPTRHSTPGQRREKQWRNCQRTIQKEWEVKKVSQNSPMSITVSISNANKWDLRHSPYPLNTRQTYCWGFLVAISISTVGVEQSSAGHTFKQWAHMCIPHHPPDLQEIHAARLSDRWEVFILLLGVLMLNDNFLARGYSWCNYWEDMDLWTCIFDWLMQFVSENCII